MEPESWAKKLTGKRTRETFACKLAVLGTPREVIKEIYEAFPECRHNDDDLTPTENWQKDYKKIYNAIARFNPLDKRFNSKKYGHVVQKALEQEYKHSMDQLLPAHTLTVKGLLNDIMALNSAPDNKHWNQIRARAKSIEAQAELLEHAKALEGRIYDNAKPPDDSGSRDDEWSRYWIGDCDEQGDSGESGGDAGTAKLSPIPDGSSEQDS